MQPDGTIDRRRLGDLVMADPPALRALETILGPGVRRAIEDRIAASSAPVVVLDAVRLIEAGLAERCDWVWVVTCDPDAQQRRLEASRGFSPEQAALRVRSQRPQAEKVAHATTVIDNRGSAEDLAREVETAWRRDIAPHLVQSSPP
jgi:dephospho-CoA kinase